MKKYNSGAPTGVISYQYGAGYISILFEGGHTYTYTYQSAGKVHVEQMKRLADAQKGLNTYINQHHPVFAEKR
ncbi:hypothetical protein LX64_02194 [Chitinophaga skermanii]|uniref:KTSC domain-containing protein n=1 Tax=Chitinophaga skermanii TaxID=331697 RepID=A0A327QL68_9BACT|nr:hypothetical protein [Chitinophaga skermanii]RAJ05040.1 hypothetical protein LX64_02194 [Chitinophaga skermanii]